MHELNNRLISVMMHTVFICFFFAFKAHYAILVQHILCLGFREHFDKAKKLRKHLAYSRTNCL